MGKATAQSQMGQHRSGPADRGQPQFPAPRFRQLCGLL